jgi:hypothetical protein
MDPEELFDNNGDGVRDGFNMNRDPDGSFGVDRLPDFPDLLNPNLNPPGNPLDDLDIKGLIAKVQAQFAQPDSTVCKAPTCYENARKEDQALHRYVKRRAKDFTDDLKVLGFTGTYCVVPSKAKVCHKSNSTTPCNTYSLEDIMSRQIKPSSCSSGLCLR